MIAHFKRSTGKFLFAERRGMKTFCQNKYVNASYIWVTIILEQFMGDEVLLNCFLSWQTIKVEEFFNGDMLSNNITQNQPKTQLVLDKVFSLPVFETRMLGCGWVWLWQSCLHIHKEKTSLNNIAWTQKVVGGA